MNWYSKLSVYLLVTFLSVLLVGSVFSVAQAETGPEVIEWQEPEDMIERITGQGPVEEIPESYDGYGVDLSPPNPDGRGTGMMTGYELPEGWEEAIGDVEELTITNSGSMPYDPATALNGKVFERLTGIELTFLEMQDAQLWSKALSSIMADTADVEVFYIPDPMVKVPQLVAADWAVPVNELYPSEVQELYGGQILNTFEVNGNFYGAPTVVWALQLYYRPSWFEKAGVEVPQSWQEVPEAAQKLNEWAEDNLGSGYTGLVYPAADPGQVHNLWAATTYSQGKKIVKNGDVKIDSEAWEVMTDLWQEGGTSQSSLEFAWSEAPQVFAQGKAGMTITSGVYMQDFSDPDFASAIQGDWEATSLPGWKTEDGVKNRAAQKAADRAYVINPNLSPEKKAAALLWLDYSRSYQFCFNELYNEGNESAMLSVYDHPKVKEDLKGEDLRTKALDMQIDEEYPPGMPQAIDIFQEYLGNVALGEMDAEEALESAQEEIDQAS